MTSKQRAYLRGLASTMDPICHVGKASLTPEVIDSVREAIDYIRFIESAVDCPIRYLSVGPEREAYIWMP